MKTKTLPTSLQLIEFDSIDSTNSWALNQCRTGDLSVPFVVVAHHQTHGQGRLGRSWYSEKGKSLCFSLALQVQLPLPVWMGLAVGIDVHRELSKLPISGLALKWPNDLLLNQLKLGGVLCQTASHRGLTYLVIGVGINLMSLQSPSFQCGALSQCGVHLAGHQKTQWVYQLACRLRETVVHAQSYGFSQFQDYFNQFDAYLGRLVELRQNGVLVASGYSLGVSDEGAYCIQTDQGKQTFLNADVSLRILS